MLTVRSAGLYPWLVLAAIFFTYINIGSYWTYIELAALDAGIDAHYVGRLLVWTSFFSLIGCAVATVISNRFGLARPLLIALFSMATIVGMLSFGITDIKILISMFSFNLLWIFVDVYQMSTVANVDRTGAFASLMPGAQGLGQIVGPNLAAVHARRGNGLQQGFRHVRTAAIVGLYLRCHVPVAARRPFRRWPGLPRLLREDSNTVITLFLVSADACCADPVAAGGNG